MTETLGGRNRGRRTEMGECLKGEVVGEIREEVLRLVYGLGEILREK